MNFLNLNPQTIKQLKRFRSIKRGYWSALTLAVLLVLCLIAELFVNNRALLVSYEGEWYFPTYGAQIPGSEFGLDYQYETNYRDLRKKFDEDGSGNWVYASVQLNKVLSHALLSSVGHISTMTDGTPSKDACGKLHQL